jgi:hypothetical protein
MLEHWDLPILCLTWTGFAIGFSAYITTPVFKKRYEDKEFCRCVSVGVGFCGLQLFLTIPVFVECEDAQHKTQL